MKYSPSSSPSADLDARVTRFSLRVAAALSEQQERGSHDISERLRFAREQAMATARAARTAQPVRAVAASASLMGASLALSGGEGRQGWSKWVSLLPVALLLGGLLLAQRGQVHDQIQATAEVDTALLSDHLPPAAYGDPGFAEFLRAEPE